MLDQKKNIILIIIFFIILLSIISALTIEHALGHQPCSLCLYERIPYFLSALLIIKIFFFKKYEKITLLILFLVFMIGALLAFYHFGIEQGFLPMNFLVMVIIFFFSRAEAWLARLPSVTSSTSLISLKSTVSFTMRILMIPSLMRFSNSLWRPFIGFFIVRTSSTSKLRK